MVRAVTLLVVASIALPASMLVGTADGAGPPDITGSQPPTSGDWDINETTVVSGQDLDLSCNITVRTPHSLTIIDSNISVDRSGPHTHLFKVESNASLVVEGSALNLSELQADTYADVMLSNSTIATSGQFLAGCVRLRAYGCTILNTAPDGPSDRHGGDAVLILGGGVDSEVRDCVVVNRGGDAGPRSIVAYGMAGGTARLVSNATSWVNCTVEDIAGSPEDGGHDIIDYSGGYTGGAGGAGGLAECIIQVRRIKRMDLTVQASSGGNGAKGGDDINNDAGDGGDGGRGGDAIVRITGASALDLLGCQLRASADWGGSGGPGGQSTMGNGGDAGQAGIAGKVEVNISAAMDLIMDDTVMRLTGGSGGWGGDYGWSETGTRGTTAPGSDGGLAALDMYCGGDMTLRRVSLKASGGVGSDGGTGYDQGGRGGGGGSTILLVRTENRIVAEDIVLGTDGGMGANGGLAYSKIIGNGGDGGNATIELNGTKWMQVRDFTFNINGGKGGHGNNPTWDGEDGTPTLDLRTLNLEMWDGTIDLPLDDLGDGAVGELHNVSFPFASLVPVIPKGNATVRLWYQVDIRLTDNHDSSAARPLENYTVTVTSIVSGEVVAIGKTDANGFVSFHLPSFLYTSVEARYLGGYLVTAVSPDGKRSKTVRIDVQRTRVRPDPFYISLPYSWHPPDVTVNRPSGGKTYTMTYFNTTLEVFGNISNTDGDSLQCVTVRLYPVGDSAGDWPTISLNKSDIPLSMAGDLEDRWGKYFPPAPNSTTWRFFYRYSIHPNSSRYTSGEYELNVSGFDGNEKGRYIIRFTIIVGGNLLPPNITLATDLDDVDWNSTAPFFISGTSSDDNGVRRVEVRLDGGIWEVANGTTLWSFQLDLGAIPEGLHTIEIQASDGLFTSPRVAHTFIIDRPKAHDDDGGGPSLAVWAPVLLALVAIAVLSVAALLLRRCRRPGA